MIQIHVPEDQWADAVTALAAELDDYVAAVDDDDATFKTYHASVTSDRLRLFVGASFRAGLLELGIKVVVTQATDTPRPTVLR